MASNQGVVYLAPGKVEVQSIDYPKLQNPAGKKIDHGVILKIVTTNICGSDQHMVRGRTTAPAGLVLGHEITGEVIEKGSDVEFLNVGDLVTVPFNIACGRCRNCREGKTGICLTVNPARPGAAYGYVDMGGWVGGQAEYVMVPYADFNLIKFPDKAEGIGEDQGSDHAFGHFPDRISRRSYRGRRNRIGGLCCGRGTGWIGLRGVVPLAGRGRGDCGRHDSGAAGAGQELRLRNHRSEERCVAGRSDRADRRNSGSGLRLSIASGLRLAATDTTRARNSRPRCSTR